MFNLPESELAVQYLRQHKVPVLVNTLLSDLLKQKPEQPIPFLIETLKQKVSEPNVDKMEGVRIVVPMQWNKVEQNEGIEVHQVTSDSEVDIFVLNVPVGGTMNKHIHKFPVLYHIIKGEAQLVVTGGKALLMQGYTADVPSGSHRTWQNVSENTLQLLALHIHTPAAENKKGEMRIVGPNEWKPGPRGEGFFTQRILSESGVDFLRITLDPGASMPSTANPVSVIYYIINGQGKLNIEGRSCVLSVGHTAVVASDVERQWFNMGSGILDIAMIRISLNTPGVTPSISPPASPSSPTRRR